MSSRGGVPAGPGAAGKGMAGTPPKPLRPPGPQRLGEWAKSLPLSLDTRRVRWSAIGKVLPPFRFALPSRAFLTCTYLN